jgi:type II secretory pathway predicted ATPase ExeA
MYTNHFSLETLPFENVPDPAYFFDQGEYNRVLKRMIDSLWAGKGLMVVAGPIGTGKTTLTQKLMASVPDNTQIIWLGEPPETSDELLLFLTQELHIHTKASGRVFVLRDIKEYLQRLQQDGNRCLLIIDEVQKVSDDVLECVRLLNNLEQGSNKLIQIFLIGQEEFLARLNRPELESFKQRIAWLEALGRMSPMQTLEYIIHRLKVSGCKAKIFSDDAMEAIIGTTRGTPRLINSLCDRTLRVGFEAGNQIVDLNNVRRAADDMGLGGEVFLWLTNREKKKAKAAESQFSDDDGNHDYAGSGTKDSDFFTSSTRNSAENQSLLNLLNLLFDKTIGKCSNSPAIQLVISVALFAASIWFYVIRTR